MAQRTERVEAMPSWVEPELATLTRERFSDPEWIFERKLDGERCLAFCGPDGVRLKSRSQHDITTTFPEIAGALAAQRPAPPRGGLIVDGEIVALDGTQTRFERLQQRLGLASPPQRLLDEIPVYYYVFDLLYADGRDTRTRPLTERKAVLADALDFREPARRALGHAAARRPGRVQRVDRRRRAAPPPLPGPARRQGAARRRQGSARLAVRRRGRRTRRPPVRRPGRARPAP